MKVEINILFGWILPIILPIIYFLNVGLQFFLNYEISSDKEKESYILALDICFQQSVFSQGEINTVYKMASSHQPWLGFSKVG